MPDLRTIRDVELIKVGHWYPCVAPDVENGWTVTERDLESVVEAHRAGVMRKTVIKLGHDSPMGDAAPALGYVDNLRLTGGGKTLVGDFVNMPAAVAKLLPHAYPDRSVEAYVGFEDQNVTTWPLVLTAVALLGASAPGIDTLRSLQDVGELYGVPIAAKRITLSIGPQRDHARAVAVAAARRRRNQRITLT